MTSLAHITLWEDTIARAGPLNMALDEVMLRYAAEPCLRVYGWSSPSISIGFSQNPQVVPAEKQSWPVVRRWTGGGMVVHDHDWTYTLAVPGSHPLSQERALESYRWVHQCLIHAFEKSGFTSLSLQAESVSDGMGLCFVEPARFDVVWDGIKIAGAAQRRARSGLLHQGSVQGIGIPARFGMLLAGEMSSQVTILNQQDAEARFLPEAELLAEGKYAKPSWLQERSFE